MDSEDPYQTDRIPNLIWVFAGCTGHFVYIVVIRLKHQTKRNFITHTHISTLLTLTLAGSFASSKDSCAILNNLWLQFGQAYWTLNYTRQKKKKKKKRNANSTVRKNYNQLRIFDKIFIFERNLLKFWARNRQLCRLTILHAKSVLLWLHVPFVSSNLNALATQRVCSTLVSAYGLYAFCAFPWRFYA